MKTKNTQDSLTVVGIGASAGGLAALRTFFDGMPPDSGMIFVVVVHLSPKHESHLAELLQRYVKMPVLQVTKTVRIKKDHVYVIPPGCNLNSVDTHLRLSKLKTKNHVRAPIDHFFQTLAKTHDGNSVGIILTGTGSDGTLGIKFIKENNGLIIVQDPGEAEFDGMPRSALSTGIVDKILPLKEIPPALVNYTTTSPRIVISSDESTLKKNYEPFLQKLFVLIRTKTGRDFSRYKRSTIMRRIHRRMQLIQLEELNDYLSFCREHPDEVTALSNDFLITVTNFFRDKEVFAYLSDHILPELISKKKGKDSLRIWSVGCATGEEAYSLAMLCMEEVAKKSSPTEIQIFASDLHVHSLAKARNGFYTGEIEEDVNTSRLNQFFIKEDGGYRIKKDVREKVIFAPHNLLSDPPFSRIDVVVCRNLLIYMQRNVQTEVIELFHYSLNSGGFLLLGGSESIENNELFSIVDKSCCLFQKRNTPSVEPRLPVFPRHFRSVFPSNLHVMEHTDEHVINYSELHNNLIIQTSPPSVLLNSDFKILDLTEDMSPYLIHPVERSPLIYSSS